MLRHSWSRRRATVTHAPARSEDFRAAPSLDQPEPDTNTLGNGRQLFQSQTRESLLAQRSVPCDALAAVSAYRKYCKWCLEAKCRYWLP
jgi:hypothetical protein